MKKSGAFSPAPVLPSDEEPRARASGEIIDSVRPSQRRRLVTFAAGAGLALVALGTWLYVLQVLMHGTFKDVVEGNTHRVFLKQPRRGCFRKTLWVLPSTTSRNVPCISTWST